MGGNKLRIPARRVEEGEAGNERDEHATPYPRRRPPPPGEPSCGHQLGGLHGDRHADHGHRRSRKQDHHAADREPSRGTGQGNGGDIGRHVDCALAIPDNRVAGFDFFGLFHVLSSGKKREETARGRCAYYLFQRTGRLHRCPAGWEGPHMNTRRLSQGGLRRGRLAAMLSAALIAVAGFSTGAAPHILTTPYPFTGGSDGGNPYAGLIADAAGNLYGTTYGSVNGGGGPSRYGTVFELTPSGTFTVLYSFTGGSDGANPRAGLIADAAGNLYGTTTFGGATAGGHPPS